MITMALVCSAAIAGAQTMYDAITFSQTNYYGTARSMGLSNAVTALGGDIGTIGINPAGAAVNSYCQFTLTPGFSISSVVSGYSLAGNGAYGTANRETNSQLTMPNVGMILNLDTGRNSGIKRLAFAMTVNSTANNLSTATAYGRGNTSTSLLGSFAAGASGIPVADIVASNAYNNTNYAWNTVMAAQSGMIATYDGLTDEYLGTTETIGSDGLIGVAGPLIQRSTVETKGNKSDILFNFSIDIADWLYLGFNIGIPTMNYSYNQTFVETAADPNDFVINYDDGGTDKFRSARYQYGYRADVTGVYAKLGFIATPVKWLRIGAAVKTPTSMNIDEQWKVSGDVNYTSGEVGSSTSPTGDWSYNFKSPFEANIGAAVTFGKKGFVSLDYELADYSVMKFQDTSDDGFISTDSYYIVNRLNSLFCGLQHSLRLGGEFKPASQFALRAGMSLVTSPEYTWTDNLGLEVNAAEYEAYFNDFESGVYQLVDRKGKGVALASFSLGAGYYSKGSFFTDLALRLNKFATTYTKPYGDYIFDTDGNVEIASPTIRDSRTLWDIALTIGWRF